MCNNLMKVDVSTHPTLSAGTPHLVTSNLGIEQAATNFAVAPDGRILLATRSGQPQKESSQLHVIPALCDRS